jgi:hypothetical protein
VLVKGNKPTRGLSLASYVITILLVAILIPLRRFDERLAIATDEIQDGVSIGIIIVIWLNKRSAA